MPDVRNCRKCGKIFNYIGGAPVCAACRQEDEEDFRRVKEYLYSNPGAVMSQVSSELKISIERIKRYLKEGRLEIVGDVGNMVLECESCGKAIRTGRFCGECERELSNNFKAAADQMTVEFSQTEGERKAIAMRYLNKNEKGKL